jgi:hypothetical protein
MLTPRQQTARLEYEQALAREVPACCISFVHKHNDQAMTVYLDYEDGSEPSTRACEQAVEVAD